MGRETGWWDWRGDWRGDRRGDGRSEAGRGPLAPFPPCVLAPMRAQVDLLVGSNPAMAEQALNKLGVVPDQVLRMLEAMLQMQLR